MQNHCSDPISPFFRFSLKYFMSPNEVNGPRISYIQSVYLIEKGEGLFEYEDRAFKLGPGVQIFLPSGIRHKWISSKSDPIVFNCVFFEWNRSSRDGIISRNDYLPGEYKPIITDYIEKPLNTDIPTFLTLYNTSKWISLFNNIRSNTMVFEAIDFPDYLKIQGQFFIFLDYIFELFKSKNFIDPRIGKLIRKMENNEIESDNKSVELWAKEAGVSRSYFHYLFKLHTGLSPNAYLNKVRIDKTIPDLINTNITITEISEKHRFNSVHYYSRLFKKITGQTLSEYRKRHQMFGV